MPRRLFTELGQPIAHPPVTTRRRITHGPDDESSAILDCACRHIRQPVRARPHVGIDEEPDRETLDPFALSLNSPNPFWGSTRITFSVTGNAPADPIRLDVYDTRGRLIRTLVDEPKPAGTHTVIWDGSDRFGSPVAAGGYYYRLKSQPSCVKHSENSPHTVLGCSAHQTNHKIICPQGCCISRRIVGIQGNALGIRKSHL